MSEENLLKYIKKNGLNHKDVISLIEKNSKLLVTREEIREEIEEEIRLKKEKALKEAEQKAIEEAKAKEEAEKEDEPGTDDLKKQVEDLTKAVADLKKSGITRKPPSKGVKTEEEDLPETVTYTVKKHMFEVHPEELYEKKV